MSKLFIRLWLTLLKQSIKRLGNDCLRRLRNVSVSETASKSLFWALSVYQDVTIRHNRPVKKVIVNLPIKMKGNSWSLLGAQNKEIGSSSQHDLAWLFYLFGINTTSDILKLFYVISWAVRRVEFETILKYRKWYLCQISLTNHDIICLYYYPQKVCNFHT